MELMEAAEKEVLDEAGHYKQQVVVSPALTEDPLAVSMAANISDSYDNDAVEEINHNSIEDVDLDTV